MRLTLLIPELLWSEPGDSDAWAGTSAAQLPKFLASRRPAVEAARPWESVLLELAGLPGTTSMAAVRAAGESEAMIDADAGHWLCADPVHLRFHQDRLILADASELALSTDELQAVASTLNASLAPHRFHLTGAERGYVRLTSPVAEAQRPLSQKVGCEIRPTDLGPDAELRRLANEIQMLLHRHPVNVAREAAGRPVVNALWLWGQGDAALAPTAAIAPSRHFTAPAPVSALLAGVARIHGGTASALDGQLAAPTADTLVFADSLVRPAQYQDSRSWAEAWRALDHGILGPAISHLLAGRVSELVIVAPTVFGVLRWSLTPWAARLARLRPGRRPSLSSLAAALANNLAPNSP